jgi:hypothetical protein
LEVGEVLVEPLLPVLQCGVAFPLQLLGFFDEFLELAIASPAERRPHTD